MGLRDRLSGSADKAKSKVTEAVVRTAQKKAGVDPDPDPFTEPPTKLSDYRRWRKEGR